MLESMTKNDRHQVLLDTLIAQLIALLSAINRAKFTQPADCSLAGE